MHILYTFFVINSHQARAQGKAANHYTFLSLSFFSSGLQGLLARDVCACCVEINVQRKQHNIADIHVKVNHPVQDES